MICYSADLLICWSASRLIHGYDLMTIERRLGGVRKGETGETGETMNDELTCLIC